jgi:hypothetical protein
MRRTLTRVDVERFAESIRELLDDSDAGLSRDARLRWEGALSALEALLREPSSLVETPHL